MRRLCFLFLALCPLVAAQSNDVGLYAVGNVNPVYFVYLYANTPSQQQVTGSNGTGDGTSKNALGAGVEYRHFWGRNGVALLYTVNPSSGRLLVPQTALESTTYASEWPLTRMDLSILATQQFRMGKFAPFLQEGPGVLITYGPTDSGLSASFALVAGMGADYVVSPHWAVRAGATWLETKQGCYGDPRCGEIWSVVQDFRLGAVYKF